MLRVVLVVVAVVLGVLAVIVAVQPDEFRVARTTEISAPTPAVFAQVNELKNWEAWSPWQGKDPQMKRVYSGPAAGAGASLAWAGNKDVGRGRMTVVYSKPTELVRLKLEFLEPFAATNSAEFSFRPEGGRTVVTWSMEGSNNFVGKAMRLAFDIDAMVGADFEKGLAGMRSLLEKP